MNPSNQVAERTTDGIFASLVALITHPVVIGSLGLILIVLNALDSPQQQLFYFGLLTLITFIPAALYLLVHFKGNVFEVLELVDREARLIPYMLMTLGALGAVVVLATIQAPRSIFIMTLVLLANEIVLGTINFWTKVSIHTATPMFTAMTLGYLLNPGWYSLIFLIPLIGWARIYRKRHTLRQVTGGATFAFVITLIVLLISHFYLP